MGEGPGACPETSGQHGVPLPPLPLASAPTGSTHPSQEPSGLCFCRQNCKPCSRVSLQHSGTLWCPFQQSSSAPAALTLHSTASEERTSVSQFSHSVVSNSLQPHGLQHARLQSITSSRSLLKLMSIKSVMPSNHLILCHSPSPSAFSLSQHQGLF